MDELSRCIVQKKNYNLILKCSCTLFSISLCKASVMLICGLHQQYRKNNEYRITAQEVCKATSQRMISWLPVTSFFVQGWQTILNAQNFLRHVYTQRLIGQTQRHIT